MVEEEYIIEYEEYRKIFFGKWVKFFESLAKFSGKILKIKIDKKKEKEFEDLNKEIHLKIKYSDLVSFASLTLIMFILLSLIFIFSNFLLTIFFIILGLLSYQLILYVPKYLYLSLEKKKEGQLILALILIAMKLRENPNLEIALKFASKHIPPPLKLDFLRILWDVYTKKYSSVESALNEYLLKWEDKAYYFVTGMQLLISSLYEIDPVRRESIIDKAIEETLNDLYIQMSTYVRELQQPINLIYMLGIVLPTLLLTVFPIASIFLSNVLSPSFLFFSFDVALPFIIYLLIKQSIETKRVEFMQKQDLYFYLYMRRNDIKFKVISFTLSLISFFVFFFLLYNVFTSFLLKFEQIYLVITALFVLSLGLSIALGSYIYYNFYRKFDERLDRIEKELSSFLFSLGNKLNENIPIERAFFEIYKEFRKKSIGSFVFHVLSNLRLGMSLEDAIFDKMKGALIYYPSSYLEASMEVIIESSKIEPKNAGKAAIAISRYFLYIEKLKLRLLDLTAEVTSQLKSLIKILAPAILGIVTGISIMSLFILYKLGIALKALQKTYLSLSSGVSGLSFITFDILSILSFNATLSPNIIYLIISLFNIIITVLSAYMLNIIENGKNPIKEKKYIYQYLLSSTILYFILGLGSSIFLWKFAESMTSFIIS